MSVAPARAQKQGKEGQKDNPIVLKGTKSTTRGAGEDPNIKHGEAANDPNKKVQPPPSKGGTKARGGYYCEVRVDNWTQWYIKIYVDGDYRGTVGPYDDGVVNVYPGETQVYGRADFNDGSSLSWGPKTYSCGSNQFIYFKMTE